MLLPKLPVLLLPSLLPCLVAGDDQVPLASKAANWLEKAKAYIPSSATEAITHAVAGTTAAEPVMERAVERINIRNYKRKLGPKATGNEEWVVYLTGANKTCFGNCQRVDTLWNESLPLFNALPQENLRLGRLDCEQDSVLCTAWQAVPPSIFHLLVPSTDPPEQKTPLRVHFLNSTTATVDDIVSIPSSSKSRYLEQAEYTGALHPFDSFLAKAYLLEPVGYVIWTLGNMPGWMMMVLLSFVSRHFMSKRMTGRQSGFGAPPPQQARPAAGAGAGAAAGVPVAAAAAAAAKGAANLRAGARKRG